MKKKAVNVLNSLRHSGTKIHKSDFWILENLGIKDIDFDEFQKRFNLESQKDFLKFIRDPNNAPVLYRFGELFEKP